MPDIETHPHYTHMGDDHQLPVWFHNGCATHRPVEHPSGRQSDSAGPRDLSTAVLELKGSMGHAADCVGLCALDQLGVSHLRGVSSLQWSHQQVGQHFWSYRADLSHRLFSDRFDHHTGDPKEPNSGLTWRVVLDAARKECDLARQGHHNLNDITGGYHG